MKVYLAMAAAVMLAAGLVIGCGSGNANPAVDTPQPAQSATTPIAEAPEAPQTQVAPPEPALPEPEPEPVPDVVAKVNDEDILGADYERHVTQTTQMLRSRGMGGELADAQKREIIEQMIDNEVLTQVAKQAGTDYSREEAEADLEEAKASMPSPEVYAQYLQKMEIDEDTLLEMMRDQKIREQFVQSKIEESPVTEEELQAEYEMLKEEGYLERDQTTADVSHILIMVEGQDEAAWEAGKEKIDEARQRIMDGEDFADVAKEVTDDPGSRDRGGAYPDTPAGQMVPEFDQRMWSQEIGEVSEPFRTQFGWHILKVTARNEAGTMELDEIREQMTLNLERRKAQEIVEETVAEAKPDMDIQVFYTPGGEEPETPVVIEEAPAE